MRTIALTNSDHVALVDDVDYPRVAGFNWHLSVGYAARHATHPTRRRLDRKAQVTIRILMHRHLLDVPEGHEVDHANRNRLDNRRSNLRIVTHQQNMWNRSKASGGKGRSRFFGVTWIKLRKKWRAQMTHNGRTITLGQFDDEEAAARAYDAAAFALRGEYAHLNFPAQRIA